MTEEEKIHQIADVLDVDASTLTVQTRLDAIGWDSMGMLSVIALAKTYGKTITGAQIRALETIGEILQVTF